MNTTPSLTDAIHVEAGFHPGMSSEALTHADTMAVGTSSSSGPDQGASNIGQAIGTLQTGGDGGMMGTPDPLSAFIGTGAFHDMQIISEPVSIGFPSGVGGEIGSLLGTDPGGTLGSVYPSSLAQFIGAMAGFQSEFDSVLYNPTNDQQSGAGQIQLAITALQR